MNKKRHARQERVFLFNFLHGANMKADQVWKMRATRDDKKTIRRVANRLKLTQSGLIRMLVHTVDEWTREAQHAERKQIEQHKP
jgi:hypothetical protein